MRRVNGRFLSVCEPAKGQHPQPGFAVAQDRLQRLGNAVPVVVGYPKTDTGTISFRSLTTRVSWLPPAWTRVSLSDGLRSGLGLGPEEPIVFGRQGGRNGNRVRSPARRIGPVIRGQVRGFLQNESHCGWRPGDRDQAWSGWHDSQLGGVDTLHRPRHRPETTNKSEALTSERPRGIVLPCCPTDRINTAGALTTSPGDYLVQLNGGLTSRQRGEGKRNGKQEKFHTHGVGCGAGLHFSYRPMVTGPKGASRRTLLWMLKVWALVPDLTRMRP